MSLIYNATFNSQTRVLSLLDKAGNVISSCEVPSKELVDNPNKPLMLRSLENASTVKLIKKGTLSNTYQISKNGEDWIDYTFGNEFILNKESVLYFRCSKHPSTQSESDYVYFKMTGKIEAWHNAYSMISSDFSSAEGEVGYYGLNSLFENCSSLTKAPLLVNALSPYCYFATFWQCSSLTQAPELPATTLASNCYQYMFNGCNSLTQAPELPATTLASNCYQAMFSRCDSLTQAPELPATTLASNCYQSMFNRCPKLKEVRISATTTASNALDGWLTGVSATGDFYCDPNATIFPTGASGCPEGWTRRNINLLNALTLTATADNSSVKLTKKGTLDNTFEVDTGNGWTAYEFDTVIPLNAGQSCKWRCSAHPTTQSGSNYVQFVMAGTIEASGNCNSMLSSDFEGITSLTGYYYAFGKLFWGCASLTKAPLLPATNLDSYSYQWMFSGCLSLKEVRIAATKVPMYALEYWLKDASSTGDFYCDPNTEFETGESGIPEGWTRHALADYPVTP